ncbi:MAG: alpha-mannosidase, partial [Lentisphaerae bacterium]
IQIREGRLLDDGTVAWDDSDWRALAKGDWLFTPDGIAHLKMRGSYPERFQDQTVYLALETAAEMIVRSNERWIGGIDPNRGEVKLTAKAVAGAPIELFLEGYNRSKPDDERHIRTRSWRGCRQRFRGARLVIRDALVEQAYYDALIVQETASSSLIGEELRTFLLTHLDRALEIVGVLQNAHDIDRNELHERLNRLRQYIQEHIFSRRAEQGSGHLCKVALVAHSHLDIAYYWRRLHATAKNARTCLIQLRLMDEFPEFKYAHTQPYLLETLRDEYPEIFAELCQREKEGRFELVGAMYVEPDCNVPGAESLARQCLYGQRFYLEHFGHIVNNCWLPDVFGNSWILPQILKLAGVDYFVSNKMSTWNDTNRFPYNHFIWKGIDGTRIPASVPPTHFITWNHPAQILENLHAFSEKNISPATLNMFGFGDGGSGVTPEMIERMRRLDKVPGLPEVVHCRGDEFLEENLGQVADQLPVWDGELYLEMHRGTFTSKAILKKMNRRLEEELRDTEMMLSFSRQLDRSTLEQMKDVMTRAWKLLLINQFHDILPGTHIAPVTRDTLRDYDQIKRWIEDVRSTCFRAAGEKDGAITLFNTLGQPRKG